MLSQMNLCRCGLPAKIVTSWTDNNPGRRFFGCLLYKVLVESIGSMKEWWMDGQKKHWFELEMKFVEDENNSVESDHKVGWMQKILGKMSISNA
ncbi:hypothetical protein N665_0234s0004 [Sinapis alba]|nr:hypothetical protein N665_0234s0004 [Sinapis alba]